MRPLLLTIIFTSLTVGCANSIDRDFINNSIFLNDEKTGFCIKNNKYYQYCTNFQIDDPHIAKYKKIIYPQGICFYTDDPIINVFSFSDPEVGDRAICKGSTHTISQCSFNCREYTVDLQLTYLENDERGSPVWLNYKVKNNRIEQFCFKECISNQIYRRSPEI